MSEKQKFAKSEKKLTLLSKTVENSEIRVKEVAKKLCYIEEQLQEIQICKKPNYKYQAHTHASQHNGWWGCKLFNIFIFDY